MSNEQLNEQNAAAELEVDDLADLDDIDFDLDEVENKIAPLALALMELRSW
ncbi:ammosamide/lymphostin RiPP family protein [Streptomyces decoyicus]